MTQLSESSQANPAVAPAQSAKAADRAAANARAQAVSNGLVRLAIIFFVFPTMSMVIRLLVTLVLGFPLMLLPEAQQSAATMPVAVVATLVSLVGSFLICRQIWPKQPSLETSAA